MEQGQCMLSSLKMRHWCLRKTLAVVRCLFLGIQKGAMTPFPEEDSAKAPESSQLYRPDGTSLCQRKQALLLSE